MKRDIGATVLNEWQNNEGEFAMKKMLSFALALLMVLTVSACSADVSVTGSAEMNPTENQIEPCTHLFYDKKISSETGHWNSDFRTLIKGKGPWVRYWHQNTADHPVRVTLYKKTWTGKKVVSFVDVPAYGQGQAEYSGSESDSYMVSVDAIQTGGLVQGQVALAQYPNEP